MRIIVILLFVGGTISAFAQQLSAVLPNYDTWDKDSYVELRDDDLQVKLPLVWNRLTPSRSSEKTLTINGESFKMIQNGQGYFVQNADKESLIISKDGGLIFEIDDKKYYRSVGKYPSTTVFYKDTNDEVVVQGELLDGKILVETKQNTPATPMLQILCAETLTRFFAREKGPQQAFYNNMGCF